MSLLDDDDLYAEYLGIAFSYRVPYGNNPVPLNDIEWSVLLVRLVS